MLDEPVIREDEDEEEDLVCEFEDIFRVDFGEYEARYHYTMKEWAVFHEDAEGAEFLYKDGEEIKESYSLFDGKVVISGDTLSEMIEAAKNVEG